MGKERVDYIDTAKFLGIVLLLIEHTGNWVNISSPIFDGLKLWICSFHMPLFFIIYGMVVSKKDFYNTRSYFIFLNKQIQTLIVPYFLWAMIYAKGYEVNFFVGVIYGSNPALAYAGTNSVLWFLPTMFFATLIYQCVLELFDKGGKKIIVFSLIICILVAKFGGNIAGKILYRFPWGIDIAFLGVAFMILGKYLCHPIIKNIMNGKNELICIVILFACRFLLSYINRPVIGEYWCPVMALGVYGKSILLFTVGAVISSCCILLISNLLNLKPLQYLGKHSLLMMAVHYIIFPYSIYVTGMIADIFHDTVIYGIFFAVLNAVVSICSMFIVCLLSDKYCSCLNGKCIRK